MLVGRYWFAQLVVDECLVWESEAGYLQNQREVSSRQSVWTADRNVFDDMRRIGSMGVPGGENWL